MSFGKPQKEAFDLDAVASSKQRLEFARAEVEILAFREELRSFKNEMLDALAKYRNDLDETYHRYADELAKTYESEVNEFCRLRDGGHK